MQTTLTTLALWAALASGEGTTVTLDWEDGLCPSRAEMVASLEAMGLTVVDQVDATGEIEGRAADDAGFRLTIRARGQEITRTLDPPGTCQQRSAFAAAIVERAVEPLFPGLLEPIAGTDSSPDENAATPGETGTDPGASSSESAAELAGAGDSTGPTASEAEAELGKTAAELGKTAAELGDEITAEAELGKTATELEDEVTIEEMITGEGGVVEVKRGRRLLLDDWRPRWVLGGSLVAAGGVGPTFRVGLDLEGRYELSPGIFTGLRLSYRSPMWNYVGVTEVRIDDAFGAIGLHIGSPEDSLAMQMSVVLQVVWARGYGFDEEQTLNGEVIDRSVIDANPGLTMGGCYQIDFDTWGLEICARGFAFLRYQYIEVNDSHALDMPLMGGEMSLGVVYWL